MRDSLIAYLAAALVLVALDFVWLRFAMGPLYQRALGPLLAENVSAGPAIVFYMLYLVGVVVFAVRPAQESGDWRVALWFGLLLGVVAYGTYDLTNMATLKGWPLRVTVLDMAWGGFLTATAASVSAVVSLAVEK